ncbi:MAG: hypothetical protein AB8G99_14370 [Planctomycetaceae bacterium]
MHAIALVVGLVVAPPVAQPVNTNVAKTVTVQFESGPVIVSHGVRPYLASGFRVADRNEQPLLQIQKPSPKKSHQKSEPKNRGGKWIRFQRQVEDNR